MIGVQLADASIRRSSHPQGKSEARCKNDALRMTKASSTVYSNMR